MRRVQYPHFTRPRSGYTRLVRFDPRTSFFPAENPPAARDRRNNCDWTKLERQAVLYAHNRPDFTFYVTEHYGWHLVILVQREGGADQCDAAGGNDPTQASASGHSRPVLCA